MKKLTTRGLLVLLIGLGSIPAVMAQANDGLARMIAELELRVALDELERVCDLSPEQQARLKAAGEAIAAKADLPERTSDAPDIERIECREDLDGGTFIPELVEGSVLQSLEDSERRSFLHKRPEWHAAVQAVLTEDQRRALESRRAERTESRLESAAQRLVASMDQHLLLSEATRTDLKKVFRDRLSSTVGIAELLRIMGSPPNEIASDRFLPAALYSIRNEDAARVLPKEQLTLWLGLKRDFLDWKFGSYEGFAEFDFQIANDRGVLKLSVTRPSPSPAVLECLRRSRVLALIDELDETCQLDASQAQKLDIVGRPIADEIDKREARSLIFSETGSFTESTTGEHSPNDLYLEPTVAWKLETESLGADRTLASDPSWLSSRDRLLRAEQRESLRAKDLDSKSYRHEAIVSFVLVDVDEHLLLSAQDRRNLRQALLGALDIAGNEHVEWVSEWLEEPHDLNRRGLSSTFVLIPPPVMRSLIQEDQWVLWNALRSLFLTERFGKSMPQADGGFIIEKDDAKRSLLMTFRLLD